MLCVTSSAMSRSSVRGRRETYAPGKETGRYWDASAFNAHWVIATDGQVEQGIRLALERVRAPGVLIEGNSFIQFILR